ncbi:MAG: S41 family peptidase [Slackia sp.]
MVVAIDGDRSQDWTATETINAVQREAGSSVVITWLRPSTSDGSEGEEFTTTLMRSDYQEPNVTTQLVDGVGYISLKQLTQNSDTLVRSALDDLSHGAHSFVLDLRDNPGGYLTKAVDVASLFIRSGVVVEIDTLEAKTTKQVTGDIATDAPLVVLVNGNTAGSAEVLAAALRDTDRAVLTGTTTMGKGSVQVTKPLSFGGALRIRRLATRARRLFIDNVGVSNITVTVREGVSTTIRKPCYRRQVRLSNLLFPVWSCMARSHRENNTRRTPRAHRGVLDPRGRFRLRPDRRRRVLHSGAKVADV